MTPVAHWSPDDYYRASRAARAAWQKTNAQLELGLEETVGEGWRQPTVSSSPSLKRVASHRDASPGGGLTASGAEPQHPSIRRTRTSAGAPADTHAGGFGAASYHTMTLPLGLRWHLWYRSQLRRLHIMRPLRRTKCSRCGSEFSLVNPVGWPSGICCDCEGVPMEARWWLHNTTGPDRVSPDELRDQGR